MNLQDLERLTAEYGEGWGLAHVRRLFKLVGQIDAGVTYDREALSFAIYLHDWGAFTHFKRTGVEHALRSKEVAEGEILPHTSLSHLQKSIVLEAIEYHDYRCVLPVWSMEAQLLREADFLDFIGAIGVAREFAWRPNQMKKALESVLARRESIRGRFTFPAAQRIAEVRLDRLDKIIHWIQEESLGEL